MKHSHENWCFPLDLQPVGHFCQRGTVILDYYCSLILILTTLGSWPTRKSRYHLMFTTVNTTKVSRSCMKLFHFLAPQSASMPCNLPMHCQAWAQHINRCQNVQFVISHSGAELCTFFFGLDQEGQYNGYARKNQSINHVSSLNRITPMLHRKWIIWNLSIAIFSTQYETITSYWLLTGSNGFSVY